MQSTEQKKMNLVNTEERLLTNKVAIKCHVIYTIVMMLIFPTGCILGTFSPKPVIVGAILLSGGLAFDIYLYRKNPYSSKIRYALDWGIGFFYMYSVITSESLYVMLNVIPILVVMVIFNEIHAIVKIGTLIAVVNALKIFILCNRGGAQRDVIVYYAVGVIIYLFLTFFLCVVSRCLKNINQIQLDKIKEEKEKSEQLLQRVMTSSKEVNRLINLITGEIQVVSDSTNQTQSAMQELESGTNETSQAIQSQMEQTQQISKKVEEVQAYSDNIVQAVIDAEEAISKGNTCINYLVEKVLKTEKINATTLSDLSSLKDTTEQMASILAIINNITTQTGLLALNASIEAARAGDAGKGFAVVASEMSGLSSQTTDATVQIEELISNVSRELEQVITSIQSMIKQVEEQNNLVKDTEKSFLLIESSANSIKDNSDGLHVVVGDLEQSNRTIIESIYTISAISEEVAAHTNSTSNICNMNKERVDMVIQQSVELKEKANAIKE